MCVPWELNPQPFALLMQCSTTEPQEHTSQPFLWKCIKVKWSHFFFAVRERTLLCMCWINVITLNLFVIEKLLQLPFSTIVLVLPNSLKYNWSYMIKCVCFLISHINVNLNKSCQIMKICCFHDYLYVILFFFLFFQLYLNSLDFLCVHIVGQLLTQPLYLWH